jgi:hypothetical protein
MGPIGGNIREWNEHYNEATPLNREMINNTAKYLENTIVIDKLTADINGKSLLRKIVYYLIALAALEDLYKEHHKNSSIWDTAVRNRQIVLIRPGESDTEGESGYGSEPSTPSSPGSTGTVWTNPGYEYYENYPLEEDELGGGKRTRRRKHKHHKIKKSKSRKYR